MVLDWVVTVYALPPTCIHPATPDQHSAGWQAGQGCQEGLADRQCRAARSGEQNVMPQPSGLQLVTAPLAQLDMQPGQQAMSAALPANGPCRPKQASTSAGRSSLDLHSSGSGGGMGPSKHAYQHSRAISHGSAAICKAAGILPEKLHGLGATHLLQGCAQVAVSQHVSSIRPAEYRNDRRKVPASFPALFS